MYDYRRDLSRYRPVGSRLCGRQIPAAVITNSEKAKVVFRTNGAVDGDGFKLFWHMECGGVFNGTDAAVGEFASPGYPLAYSNNLLCNYTLLAPGAGDFVVISFLEPFELESRKLQKF